MISDTVRSIVILTVLYLSSLLKYDAHASFSKMLLLIFDKLQRNTKGSDRFISRSIFYHVNMQVLTYTILAYPSNYVRFIILVGTSPIIPFF